MTSGTAATSGRLAQRRRTRKAIVDATSGLLRSGREDPSIAEIAAAADVSRRTVYMYFPTLDQLLLDATVGAMSTDIDQVLAEATDADPQVRVEKMIDSICRSIGQSLPMGRKLIKLTVDRPPTGDGPKRGYRRIGWIEQAIEPLRAELGPRRFERLVSGLAMVVGWEAFIVLQDLRGLTERQSRQVSLSAAMALIDAAKAEANKASERA